MRVLKRHTREHRATTVNEVTVAAIYVQDGVEVRAQLARWGGREAAHLRTWFRGRDGRWRPTRRGVSVAPGQLEELEAAVRTLREAHASGALESTPIVPGAPTST